MFNKSLLLALILIAPLFIALNASHDNLLGQVSQYLNTKSYTVSAKKNKKKKNKFAPRAFFDIEGRKSTRAQYTIAPTGTANVHNFIFNRSKKKNRTYARVSFREPEDYALGKAHTISRNFATPADRVLVYIAITTKKGRRKFEATSSTGTVGVGNDPTTGWPTIVVEGETLNGKWYRVDANGEKRSVIKEKNLFYTLTIPFEQGYIINYRKNCYQKINFSGGAECTKTLESPE
jgi:hypothetical protein